MEEKLSVKIYDTLRNEIISGKINARTFLSESEVAKRFQVSKAPVRDALHLLNSQGYLTSYPRKGYLVNVYTEKDLQQIQQIRKHLEKLCIELAIKNASDEEILSLKEYAISEEQWEDPLKTNNTRFHMQLAVIGKNEYLPGVLIELLSKVSLIAINKTTDTRKHQAIIDALLHRDYDEAVACLEADMEG
ncbi:MAG: GntR family transcriptional regulator [Clostridia bacterium]|nr:GntR family transcriptional regulator [Clostridia bacterium]